MTEEVFPALSETTASDTPDFFGFCNRLAWQVGGPVIVHDVDWNVLAYSTLPQPIDEARRQAILRRKIPQDLWEVPVRETIDTLLSHGPEVFEAPPITQHETRRLVAPIYVGDRPVGLMWVAESAGELSPDAFEILTSAAKHAAVFFGSRTLEQRREEGIFMSLLLDGSRDVDFLGQCLGIGPTHWIRVATVWHPDPETLHSGIHRAHRSIDSHGSTTRVVCVQREDRLHAVFVSDDSRKQLLHDSERHAQHILRLEPNTYIAFSDMSRLAGIAESRDDADHVMNYLCHHPDQHLSSFGDVHTGVALMDLATTLGQRLEGVGGLSRLDRLDPADRAESIRTLDAFLEAMGTISEAARLLHVHPNTLRYRLAKIAEILDVDLDDRETRLLLELELLWEKYRNTQPH